MGGFFFSLYPKNNLGQRVGALKLSGNVQDVVIRVGGDAGGYEGLKDAAQGKQTDSGSRRDFQTRIAHIKKIPLPGPAAGTLDFDDGDFEVFEFHGCLSIILDFTVGNSFDDPPEDEDEMVSRYYSLVIGAERA